MAVLDIILKVPASMHFVTKTVALDKNVSFRYQNYLHPREATLLTGAGRLIQDTFEQRLTRQTT